MRNEPQYFQPTYWPNKLFERTRAIKPPAPLNAGVRRTLGNPASCEPTQYESPAEQKKKPGKQPGAKGFGRTQKFAVTGGRVHRAEACTACGDMLPGNAPAQGHPVRTYWCFAPRLADGSICGKYRVTERLPSFYILKYRRTRHAYLQRRSSFWK